VNYTGILVDLVEGTVECSVCGRRWTPMTKEGRWPAHGYRCPEGCEKDGVVKGSDMDEVEKSYHRWQKRQRLDPGYWDQFGRKPVFVPLFIWDDGEVRPFQGKCRGAGAIWDYKKRESSIGVYTDEGQYFTLLIDTSVRCAIPQFVIDEKPFYFPIVSFHTMGAWVDPVTGKLVAPPV
jgi:hypothetical protein